MPRNGKSRKRTPWDGEEKLTATQEFLKMHYKAHYEQHHPKLNETGEAAMINAYEPEKCPIVAQSILFGKGATKTVSIDINTSADKPEWIEYCLKFASI